VVAQVASMRPWVQSPVSPKKQKLLTFQVRRHYIPVRPAISW
jgi:hypothetical protein